MTASELLKASRDGDDLRAELFSLKKVNTWLNNQVKTPDMLLGSQNVIDVVKTEVQLDYLYFPYSGGRVGLRIDMVDPKLLLNFEEVDAVFGRPDAAASCAHNKYRIWKLSMTDWPFLTVELVSYGLRLQKAHLTHHCPNIISQYLPTFFPNTNYLELLDWYKNGMLSLSDDGSGLPVLCDVMRQQSNSIAATRTLPIDLALWSEV